MPADNRSSMPGEPAGADRNVSRHHLMSQSWLSFNLSHTFINTFPHDISPDDRKIDNTPHRNAVRAHVMKGVRHIEQQLGIKRPTGREKGRKKSNASATTARRARSSPRSRNVRKNNNASATTARRASSTSRSRTVRKNSNLAHATEEVSRHLEHMAPITPIQYQPSVLESDLAAIVDSLEVYCRLVYIPMTFPVEKSEEERSTRWNKIKESKHENLAVFYGIMATVAAHQAIINEEVKDFTPSGQDNNNNALTDIDYSAMRGEAIRHTRLQLAQTRRVDVNCVESILSLISAASIVGNFEEAQLHLRSIMTVLRTATDLVNIQKPDSHWIPMIDVKASVATMTKPYFRLPWPFESIPTELVEKITPHDNLPFQRVGSSFWLIPTLSMSIVEIMKGAAFLCWFCQFSHECSGHLDVNDHERLNAIDHEIFRRKTLELEYDLITYAFHVSSPNTGHHFQELVISPLERMIRLAALAMISSTVTQVLPATGVGRALTGHQVKATQDYFNSRPNMTDVEAKLVIWIMFQYTQGALGQPEERCFRQTIANVNNIKLHINSWVQIEEIAYMFLWIPAQQEDVWRKIWEDIAEFGAARSESSSMSITSPL